MDKTCLMPDKRLLEMLMGVIPPNKQMQVREVARQIQFRLAVRARAYRLISEDMCELVCDDIELDEYDSDILDECEGTCLDCTLNYYLEMAIEEEEKERFKSALLSPSVDNDYTPKPIRGGHIQKGGHNNPPTVPKQRIKPPPWRKDGQCGT